jgi:hypothetical protein
MSVPRWLLLVALVLGVVGMHTLGHPEPSHAHDKGVVPAAHSWEGPSRSWSGPTAVLPLDEDRAATRQTSHEDLPTLDPLAVCLAILAPVTLLVVAWFAVRVRHPAVAGLSTRGGWGRGVVRPPPRRTAVRLALLSVLRT